MIRSIKDKIKNMKKNENDFLEIQQVIDYQNMNLNQIEKHCENENENDFIKNIFLVFMFIVGAILMFIGIVIKPFVIQKNKNKNSNNGENVKKFSLLLMFIMGLGLMLSVIVIKSTMKKNRNKHLNNREFIKEFFSMFISIVKMFLMSIAVYMMKKNKNKHLNEKKHGEKDTIASQ